MLEFSFIMLMAAFKCVAYVCVFVAGVYSGGYLFRKGWDDAGAGRRKGGAK